MYKYFFTNYQMDFSFAEYFSYLLEYKFQLLYYYYDPVILVYVRTDHRYESFLVKLLKGHLDNLYTIIFLKFFTVFQIGNKKRCH